MTWCNVSSCLLSVKVIQDFLEESEDSTLFMIEVVNGKDFTGYTINPSEEEVILSMGTRLRVKDNTLKHGKLNLIHLIEIDNQVQVMDLPSKPSDKRIVETDVEEKQAAYSIIWSIVFLNCFVSSVRSSYVRFLL